MPLDRGSIAAPIAMPCTTFCPMRVDAGGDAVVYASTCTCPSVPTQDGCGDGFVIVIVVKRFRATYVKEPR